MEVARVWHALHQWREADPHRDWIWVAGIRARFRHDLLDCQSAPRKVRQDYGRDRRPDAVRVTPGERSQCEGATALRPLVDFKVKPSDLAVS
jgi:hypothetical protein